MNDAKITLRFQDNQQNCRMIVTQHKYTFILFRYNKILNSAYKNTPDNAENLVMLFSEMFILEIPGGPDPPPPTDPLPLDPRLKYTRP